MTTPYDRAVDRFIDLCDGFRLRPAESPRALFEDLGIPVSSGYRQAALFERHGILQQDTDGRLSLGPTALEIGLSALGLGRFAAVTPPVLEQLRRATRMTSCLAIHSGRTLRIGPMSLGRGHSHVVPASDGIYTVSRADTGRAVHRYVLLAGDSAPTFGFLTPIGSGQDDAHALLGVLARKSAFSDATAIADRVERAAAQIADAVEA